jgi:DNA mismatch endonuclease (patch repair protein)
MDTFSKAQRSRIMASVKAKGNKSTELKFLSILKANDVIGWRRNYPLLGRPDFVFPKFRVAVFIDGCFWHGCSQHCRMPSSNKDYWIAKIDKNIKRDKKISKELRNKNWKVIRVWEHDIKSGIVKRKIGVIKKIAQQGIGSNARQR